MQETERELKLTFRNKSDVPDMGRFMSVVLKTLRSVDAKASLRLDSIARTKSVYWDTQGFQLAREGLALRVRTVDGQTVVTVKTESMDETGADRVLRQRSEFHWTGNAPRKGISPDLHAFRDSPVGVRLLAACENEQLIEVFTSNIMRSTFSVEFSDGGHMTMMLDIGKLVAGKGSESVRELEIELKAGPPERLYKVALALVKKLRLVWYGTDKFLRGILLAGGPALDPPRPALSAVQPEQPITGSLSTALREGMERVIASCIRFDRDPYDSESVHDFRVDLRYVRSLVDFLHPLLNDETYEKMQASLRILFKPTSCLREADMLMASWRLFCEETARKEDGRLVKKFCRHRKSCLDRVLRDRVSTRWSYALLFLAAWTSSPQYLGDATAVMNYAEDRLASLEQQVIEHAKPESLIHSQDYHALRIQVKRLRMMQTVFRPGTAADSPRWETDALKQLQDALGDYNDAHVNLGMAESLVGGKKQAAAFISWLSDQRDCLLAKCMQLLDASVRT